MNEASNYIVNENGINIKNLIKLLWEKKKFMLKVIGLFACFGLFLGIITTAEYESQVSVLPEIYNNKTGTSNLITQVASLGGINLDNAIHADVIRPDLFPNIIQSLPFHLYLMNQDIHFVNLDTTLNLKTFFLEHNDSYLKKSKNYVFYLPRNFKSLFKSKGNSGSSKHDIPAVLSIDKDEYDISSELKKRITARLDLKSGIFTIKVKMPDPYASAQLADIAVEYLTEYITNYRVEKVKQNLLFLENRYVDVKSQYYQSQDELARFRENNMNIYSATARTKEERLIAQSNLSFNVFNAISQQLEQAKIKVQEETPVFKVLNPVHVPLVKSEPRRLFLLIIFSVLGFLVSSVYVIARTLK